MVRSGARAQHARLDDPGFSHGAGEPAQHQGRDHHQQRGFGKPYHQAGHTCQGKRPHPRQVAQKARPERGGQERQQPRHGDGFRVVRTTSTENGGTPGKTGAWPASSKRAVSASNRSMSRGPATGACRHARTTRSVSRTRRSMSKAGTEAFI